MVHVCTIRPPRRQSLHGTRRTASSCVAEAGNRAVPWIPSPNMSQGLEQDKPRPPRGEKQGEEMEMCTWQAYKATRTEVYE